MQLKSRVTLGLATTAVAVGAVLVPATMASAATPTLTVTQNTPTGLNEQNGGTVTAVGAGYTPGATIALVQCSTVTADGAGCDQTPANARLVAADSNGGFTVSNLVVTTGPKGNGTCGAGSTCFVAGANPANTTEAAADDFKFDNLQVSPRTNLKNGQVLTLVGGGFTASHDVFVAECSSLDPSQALNACDVSHAKSVKSNANGAFTTTYAIRTGAIGNGTCNSSSQTCGIGATDNQLVPQNGHIGGALLKFAPVSATSLTAKSTRASVVAGHRFAVKGQLKSGPAGVNGAKVTLYKVVKSKATKLGTKTTRTVSGHSGSYAFSGLKQAKTSR